MYSPLKSVSREKSISWKFTVVSPANTRRGCHEVLGMVEKSLPDLRVLMDVAWRGDEVQELLSRLRPAKPIALTQLFDRLFGSLDEKRVWRRVTTERGTFEAAARELLQHETQLLRASSTLYGVLEDHFTVISKVVQELETALGPDQDEVDLVRIRRTVEQTRTALNELGSPPRKRSGRAGSGRLRWLERTAFETGVKEKAALDRFDTVYEDATQVRRALRLRMNSLLIKVELDHEKDPRYTELRDHVVATREELVEAIIQKALLPIHLRPALSKLLEEQDRDYHGKILRTTKAPGLAFLSDREYDVPTRSHSALVDLMENLHGGSIGLSGPRGAGKTTLLRTMTEPGREFRGRTAAVSELVPAPVEYQPKEFVLHLFQRVCDHVIKASSTAPSPPHEDRANASTLHLLSKLALVLLVAGAAGWSVFTLLSRPPQFTNAAFAAVLGALIPLSLHGRFTDDGVLGHSRQGWVSVQKTLALAGVAMLMVSLVGGVIGASNTLWSSTLWFNIPVLVLLALGTAPLHWTFPRTSGTFSLLASVVIVMSMIGFPIIGVLAPWPHPSWVLVMCGVPAIGMLVWIRYDAIDMRQAYGVAALRGVLLASGSLAFAWTAWKWPSQSGLAWLVWGAVMILLAVFGGLHRVSALTPIAASLSALVPLAFGGITANWTMAVVGAVLLLIGCAVPLDGGTLGGRTSSRAMWLQFRSAQTLPLITGTTLLVAAGANSSIGLPAIVSVAVLLVGIVMYCGVRDFLDEEAPRTTPAFVLAQPHTRNWADGLAAEAQRHRDEVRFQLTESTTWSRVFKASAGSGFSVGVDSSTGGGASRQMLARTYPEIVDSFRTFLGEICAHGPVVIAIDEIDKLEPEAAGRFLNDIKAIFGVPGCYYLVSLSEDAMASFERRGLPIRDVFESSFDDVLHVDHLTFEECRALLSERVAGLPLALLGTCYVVSGGIARELIRVARRVFAIVKQHDTWLIDEIAERLVLAELDERSRGIVPSVNGAKVEVASAALRVIEHAKTPLSFLPGTAIPHLAAGDDSLRRTIGTLAAYNYILSTLVEFLRGADENTIKKSGAETSPQYLGGLAVARQLIAVDSTLAWAAVSAFRNGAGLAPVGTPALFS